MAKRIALVVLVLLVGFGIYGWAQVVPAPAPAPDGVVSGSDLGFRVERRNDQNAAVGRLMVRINGVWVEATFSNGARIVPLQTR